MLKQAQLEKYLGRSLTTLETTHLKEYSSIAETHFQDMLCLDICDDSDTKSYDGRLGYRLLYIDPLTSVSSVKVNGEEVAEADYTLKQWDNRNAKWFNVIEFKDCMDGDVEITGSWGFDEFPSDLALLYARVFNSYSESQDTTPRIKSKKIEDFTVTYADTDDTEVLEQNARIIRKYSNCRNGGIRHGEVRHGHLHLIP